MMKPTEVFERKEMNTLTECIELIEKRGFETNFWGIEDCKIKGKRDKPYEPSEVKINTFIDLKVIAIREIALFYMLRKR